MANRRERAIRNTSRGKAAFALLAAIASVLAWVLAAGPAGALAAAWADDASATPAGSSASNGLVAADASDGDDHLDREYLGGLFRQGDFWYWANPTASDLEAPLFRVVDGRVYATGEKGAGWSEVPYNPATGPWATYYYDAGEIVYTATRNFDIEKIALSKMWSFMTDMSPSSAMYYPTQMYEAKWFMLGKMYQFTRNMRKQGTKHVSSGSSQLEYEYELKKVVFTSEFADFVSHYCLEGTGDMAGSLVWSEERMPNSRPDRAKPPDGLGEWNGMFDGEKRLVQVEGIGSLVMPVQNLARAFTDCEKLKELDLSGFDTQHCTDFTDMLDGCVTLSELTVGERWSQRDALDDDAKARFPLDMTCGEGDDAVLYRAGEIIPDGPATYVATGHIDLGQARVSFFKPGTFVVPEADLAAYESGERAYPAGVTAADVHVWKAGDAGAVANAAAEIAGVFDYTGAEVRPAVAVEIDGELLEEGVDFTLDVTNGVEEGIAQVTILGRGKCYGRWKGSFEIVDPVPYGFLYENGLLLVKTSHAQPLASQVSSSVKLVASHPWLDGQGGSRNGAWAALAPKVKRVVFDDSFASCKPTSVQSWFSGCKNLARIDGWEFVDTAGVRSAANLFQGCAVLPLHAIPQMRFGALDSAAGMFSGCAALVSFDSSLASFTGAKNAANMFSGCSHLTSVDLSGVAFGRVVDVTGMFSGCAALETLDLGGMDLSAARGANKMLDSWSKLVTLRTGAGWRNGTLAAGGALSFGRTVFRTAPSSARCAAGKVVPNGKAEYRYGSIAVLFTTVELDAASYDCTGKPVQPKPTVRLGDVALKEGVDYTLSYKDNLYPGKASMTILGKGSFSGGYIVPFTITAPIVKVGDKLTYKTKKATYTLKVTSVKKENGVVVPKTVSIVGLQVMSSSTKTLTLPNACTVGDYFVTVTAIDAKLVGNFKSVSAVVVGANVVIIGARSFAKAPKVKKLVVKSARLKRVTNCLAGSKVKRVTAKVWLSKKDRKKYKKWFTKKAGKKGVKFVYA